MIEDLLIRKCASKKEEEHSSILPYLAGAGIIGSGMILHDTNKMLKGIDSFFEVEKMKKAIKDLPHAIEDIHIPEGVTLIRDKADVMKYVDKYEKHIPKDLSWQEIGLSTRKGTAKALAEGSLNTEGLFVGAKKPLGWKPPEGETDFIRPFVFAPKSKNTGGQIIAHELGHYDQYINGDIERMMSARKRVGGYFKSIINPKKQALYRLEEDAWNRSGIEKGNPVREHALKTYENNARLNRTHAIGTVTGLGGMAIIGNELFKDAETN